MNGYEREISVYKLRIPTPYVLSTGLPKAESKIYYHTPLTAP